jgi:hypothetical protein
LRDRGLTIGRLDSRYRGARPRRRRHPADFDPALTSWNHAFAPAINYYLRDVLEYRPTSSTGCSGRSSPWNSRERHNGVSLRRALAQNPYLHVMVQSGYFDGGTDYFNAKYTMWNMDPAGRFQDRHDLQGLSQRSHDVPAQGRPRARQRRTSASSSRARTPKPGQPAKR